MGRVIEIRQGQDGVIRSVLIKTVTGDCERGVKRLVPLPISVDNECNSKT